jgi:hypothetical protein
MDIDLKAIKKSIEFLNETIKKDPEYYGINYLKTIRMILQKVIKQSEENVNTEDINPILFMYSQKIKKLRQKDNEYKLTLGAIGKLRARLKSFSQDELLRAITNFAQADWWMEHNAHRGVQWFFHSDDRIEMFINMSKEKVLDPAITKLRKSLEK